MAEKNTPPDIEAPNIEPIEAPNSTPNTKETSGRLSPSPIHPDAQPGVQAVEGMATIWPRTALLLAYVWIWVIFFVYSMQSQVIYSLNPYVTSAFQSHSLTPTVTIFSSIIGGVGKLTLAKILDVWGRPQGFGIAVFFLTVGLITMAGCGNVETYAAAQVFWYIG